MSILLMFLTAASTPQGDFPVRIRANYIATLTASFHQSDTNKDGVLDFAEMLGAARKSMNLPALSANDEAHFEAAMRNSFAMLDSNKDGHVSLDEALRMPLANFDCLDANHDGLIPASEAEANIDQCEAASAKQ